MRFRLRELTVDEVIKHFDALCSCVDHDGVPTFVQTVAANRVELGRIARRWPLAHVTYAERDR